MTDTACNNCGAPKPDDKFRACPDCRAAWRQQSRKPNGPANTIDQLRAENARLKKRIAELERKAT